MVSDELRVPKVEHPDYLGCERLRTVSKDEMISTFCKSPSNWGDRQFTPCKAFAKIREHSDDFFFAPTLSL